MAFDVYVGGFSRFYAMEWENVGQAWARENDAEYKIVGPDGETPQPVDWNDVAVAVDSYKSSLNEVLGTELATPLDWDETREAPYFTDRPGYEGYGALLVWAAHAERGTSPPEFYDDNWFADDAYIECSEPTQGQKYRAIVCGTLWLPGEFEFSFESLNLVGEKVHVCSNASLLKSLEDLNQATFQMAEDEINQTLQGYEDDDPSLETLARFGWSVFFEMAKKSVEHRLPIMLSM